MKIDFTKKQYKELLLLVLLGDWVRGGVADSRGKYDKKMDELKDYLLSKAKDFGLEKLTEVYEDALLPSDKLDNEVEEIMEAYDEDEFWHQLVTEMGKRDFFRTITEEERNHIKKEKWLPERVYEVYQKYEKEFEKNGIERLEIVFGK